MTKEQVISAAKALSVDDRFDVIAAIDPAADEFVMNDSLRVELDRRWAEYEADPTNVFTWEQVEAELDADE